MVGDKLFSASLIALASLASHSPWDNKGTVLLRCVVRPMPGATSEMLPRPMGSLYKLQPMGCHARTVQRTFVLCKRNETRIKQENDEKMTVQKKNDRMTDNVRTLTKEAMLILRVSVAAMMERAVDVHTKKGDSTGRADENMGRL